MTTLPLNKLVTVKKPIVVIIGTTGVGKSKFSIDLASKYNGEIINADSMQMYENCPIITNKHPINERNGIPHHVMNHIKWDEEYFIHRFQKEALRKIDEIHKQNKLPIIVGGTNYYLQSLLFTNRVMYSENSASSYCVPDDKYLTKEELVKKLPKDQQEILNSKDPMVVYNSLQQIDPIIANKFHPSDTRRVRRVLEIYYQTNEKPSKMYERQLASGGDGAQSMLRFDTLVYWLWSKQDVLNDRLDNRVDDMIRTGALDEIKLLYDLYLTLPEDKKNCEHGIWQVIGFKEFLPWLNAKCQENSRSTKFEAIFDSKDKLLAEAIDKMKQKTRKYSKNQIKWIKNVLIKELTKNHNNPLSGTISNINLLNATDLSIWEQSVAEAGFKVYEDFTHKDVSQLTADTLVHISEDIKQFLYPPEAENKHYRKITNKSLLASNQPEQGAPDSELVWKQFKCDICKNKDTDTPLILMGEEQWTIHLNGRRHRSNLNRSNKKKNYELWAKRQKVEAAAVQEPDKATLEEHKG